MKKNKKIVPVVMAIIMLASVIVASVFWVGYSSGSLTSNTANELSDLYLRELSNATGKHLETMLDYHYALVDSISNLLTEEIACDDEQFHKFINETKEMYGLSYLAFVDESGYYHNSSGVYSAAGKVSFLGSLLKGETHLISYNENIQNQNVIMIGARMKPIKVSDTNFIAILASLDSETMSKRVMLSNEQSQTYSSVVTDDGTYVLFGNTKEQFKGSNLLSAMKKSVSDSDMAQLMALTESLVESRSGMIYFTTKNGDAFYLYNTPLENTDWHLITLMPYEVIEGTIQNLGHAINRNSTVIFILFFAILLIIFVLYIKNSKKKQKQLEKAKSAAEQAFKIAEEANSAKSVFLSNMSHDIRTPMNAIVGFSTLLTKDADNEEKVREYSKKITLSSQHLLGLINDVLDMAKIESGKTTLNMSKTNLSTLIEDINTIIRPQMKSKRHTFDIFIRNVRHETVNMDKLRMHQILLNLLSNAVKYTPDGGHIILTLEELPQTSQQYAKYRFSVKDNGYGIEPEYLNSVFDVFSREQNSVINKIQGTGLGLAITKNLVTLMGGKISVESEKGKGSVFTVDVELMIADDYDVSEFWKTNHISKLLVVDDDESVCKNVAYTMEELGVKVDYSLEGNSAIKLVKAAEELGDGYHTILLDWQIPGKDGIQIAKEIRKLIPSNVSIMILTGYDYSEIEEEMLNGVIDGFIPKPFFESNLRHKLQEIMERTEKPQAEEEPEEAESAIEGLNILIAEDNELNAEILTEILKMKGATSVVRENGFMTFEAFEHSPENYYDLILMDVQMPVMDGYQATRLIRDGSHPQAKTVPIIAMTANAFAEDIQNALNAGMNAHLAKPIDVKSFEKVVRELKAGKNNF